MTAYVAEQIADLRHEVASLREDHRHAEALIEFVKTAIRDHMRGGSPCGCELLPLLLQRLEGGAPR